MRRWRWRFGQSVASMGMHETQRKWLDMLRALERDDVRLSVDDFILHVERETGWRARWYQLKRHPAARFVRRHDADDTVTVEGALAMDEEAFADLVPEPPRLGPPGLTRVAVIAVAPPLDRATRSRVERQLAEDAARCEAADVIMDPPFLPPQLRTPSQQRLWKNPYIYTYTAEAWSSAADRAVWIEAFPAGISYEVHTVDTGPGRWGAPRPQGMFGTLDDALACVAICRARDD
jgi:hypothetical protein